MTNSMLAELYVNIVAKGFDHVKTATREIERRLREAGKANDLLAKALASGRYEKVARQMAEVSKESERLRRAARLTDLTVQYGQIGGSLRFLQERMEGVGSASKQAFAILSASTLGWVTAGIQGTVEANRLSMGFQVLSRQVAGIFKPAIDEATRALFKLVDWFRALDGSTQGMIRRTILWTAAALALIPVLRMLITVKIALVGAVGMLRTAFSAITAAMVANPFLAIAAAAAVAVAAIIRVVDALSKLSVKQFFSTRDLIGNVSEQELQELEKKPWEQAAPELFGKMKPSYARKKDEEKKEERTDVTPTQTGFESFSQTYDRLAEAVSTYGSDNTPEGRTAINTAKIAVAAEALHALATQFFQDPASLITKGLQSAGDLLNKAGVGK